MEDPPVNRLLSTQKPSDSNVQVALHPLPILEISDYITRAYQRGQNGAIVGALLGQQSGREITEITIEHSFSCKTSKNEDGHYTLDFQWFKDRLEQMKLVHKDPPLDLVGWYTLVPKSGPSSHHLPIHNQFLEASKESTVLLGFHTEDVLRPAAGNPLPLTIYESNMEAEDSSGESQAEGEDKEMKDLESPAKMVLKFRELPFTTETGDAEMIAMQFIREGGANATVEESKRPLPEPTTNPNTKGKQRALSKEEEAKAKAEAASQAPKDAVLSKEDSELISALQAKANAVKMMKARLGLLISYLERLPPEPFTDLQTSTDALAGQDVAPSYNILRQIQALVTNVELVTPRQQDALQKEMLQESNDVKLISLVKDLLSSVSEIREVGKKFAITDIAQAQKPPRRAYDSAMNQKLSVGEIINQKLVIGDAGDLHFG